MVCGFIIAMCFAYLNIKNIYFKNFFIFLAEMQKCRNTGSSNVAVFFVCKIYAIR